MANQNSHKILFLAKWYPDKNDPMFGLFIKRHVLSVIEFCKPSVLFISSSEKISQKFNVEFELEDNIPTIRVYFKKPRVNIPLFTSFLMLIRYIKANLIGYDFYKSKFGNPDIVHVNVLSRTGLLALYLKFSEGIPYIISEHWSRYLPINNTYKGFLRKCITKMIVKKASAITTVSENLKNAMVSHGLNNKYFIIPNVVDVYKFMSRKDVKNIKKRIINISCFEDKSKNISGILRVTEKLSKKRDDFELYLVGDGVDFEQMKKLAEDLKILNKFVFFEGLKENSALIESLGNSDFMVLFSNYENQPVVILESLSCGIPVIATEVGGIPEIISNENGIIVKPKDEETLLKKLDYMLDNSEKFDKEKLRNYAINNFSNKIVGNKFNEIYLSLLS